MKKLLVPAFSLVVSAFFFSCNNEAAKTETAAAADSFNLDSVKAAIAVSNISFGNGFSNSDSTVFASHYTSDACINPSNMPKICGSAAITAYFNGGYKMGIRNIKITTSEIMGGKDDVVETGNYEIFADKGISVDKGKYMVLWKMENGKWKMYRDIWNSDLPVPAAAPEK